MQNLGVVFDDVQGLPMADVITFNTRAEAQAAAIPASVNIVLLAGYSTIADAPTVPYVRVASEPSHKGKFQSADLSWWRLDPQGTGVDIRWFGATPILGFDNRGALVNAIESVTFSFLAEDRLNVRSVFIP